MHADLILLYLRIARAQRTTLLLVLDNVVTNKCGFLLYFFALLLKANLIKRVVVLYLYPGHGKWIADARAKRFGTGSAGNAAETEPKGSRGGPVQARLAFGNSGQPR